MPTLEWKLGITYEQAVGVWGDSAKGFEDIFVNCKNKISSKKSVSVCVCMKLQSNVMK